MSYPQTQNPLNPNAPTVIYVTATPATTAPLPVPPPTQIIVANTRWHNKPQFKATTAGGFIFITGGMNLAMSVGWGQYALFGSVKHFCYSWFIGVIIGTILSEILRSFIPKRIVMGISAGLVIVGGILFVSSPYSYDMLIAGRYINGIAVGLAIVTFLMNAAEIADTSYRGRCLIVEQSSFSSGIAIQMIFASYLNTPLDFPANRLHGILVILFAMFAGIALMYFLESPIDHIRKGDDAAALDTLARLRRPRGVTLETNALLEENKAYVREQENMSVGEGLAHGLLPLVKLLVFRSMLLVFCYSMPLNLALQLSMINTGYTWAPTVAGICRMLGGMITLWLVDTTGRKLSSVVPILFIGGLLIAIGAIVKDLSSIFSFSDMSTVNSLFIVIQLFVGFFVPHTSILMGEAFPLLVKPFLMGICVIAEQIIHIIFIATFSTYIGDSLMAQGVIAMVAFLCLCVTMPETSNTSLAEAQRRCRKLFNLC